MAFVSSSSSRSRRCCSNPRAAGSLYAAKKEDMLVRFLASSTLLGNVHWGGELSLALVFFLVWDNLLV